MAKLASPRNDQGSLGYTKGPCQQEQNNRLQSLDTIKNSTAKYLATMSLPSLSKQIFHLDLARFSKLISTWRQNLGFVVTNLALIQTEIGFTMHAFIIKFTDVDSHGVASPVHRKLSCYQFSHEKRIWGKSYLFY